MKLLEMKHVGKSFGELEVLKDISMEVEEGEVCSNYWTIRLRKINPASLCNPA